MGDGRGMLDQRKKSCSPLILRSEIIRLNEEWSKTTPASKQKSSPSLLRQEEGIEKARLSQSIA